MSQWQDDEHDGEMPGDDLERRPSGFGGDFAATRPSFDDPMTWSFRFGRLCGIDLRVHLFFGVYVLVRLASVGNAGESGGLGLLPTALMLAAAFVVVLLHELGHCAGAHYVGGRATQVLMWPLGGLASCVLPNRPSAHLITAAAGPLANVAIVAVLGTTLYFVTGIGVGVAIPNPLDLNMLILHEEVSRTWWTLLLAVANWFALLLLLFNLLPIFPLDGGKIVQALLWPKMGFARSMRMSCRIGLVGAVAVGVFALIRNDTMLLGIALFGGITCYLTNRRVAFEADFLGFSPEEAEPEEEPAPAPPQKRSMFGAAPKSVAAATTTTHKPTTAASTAADASIDRILDKISRDGMGSLTPAEQEVLRKATDERRKRDGRG
ncbi:MAG: hypothetical protein EXS10_03635 [Phycisphaerales bacterium]|nr:hypothetical protein [Phycisphaerales bacterium]